MLGSHRSHQAVWLGHGGGSDRGEEGQRAEGVLWAVWGRKVGAVWEGEGQHGQGGGH